MSLVEHTPRAGVIWSGATEVRARPWKSVPGRAYLFISGSHGPSIHLPEPPILLAWLATLSSWGYSSVRTSALAPAAAKALSGVGFTVAQELRLLERHHGLHRMVPGSCAPQVQTVRISRFRRSIKNSLLAEILATDLAAFGEQWTMDAQTLREAFTATRRTHLIAWRADNGRIDGFLLVGATGQHGFIQRLAVRPDAQRSGIATHLIATALEWANDHGCTSTIVNTDVSNNAALGAYERFGFASMEYGLSVLERQITP